MDELESGQAWRDDSGEATADHPSGEIRLSRVRAFAVRAAVLAGAVAVAGSQIYIDWLGPAASSGGTQR